MNSSQFHKDLNFIKATPTDVLVKKHLKAVFETYHRLFGEVCTGCPNKITGYINRIKNYKIEKVMSDKKKSFVLKTDALIVIKGTSKAYSNANLTDELALSFLKRNPNRKVLFSKLPENLAELLAAKPKKSVAKKTGNKKTAHPVDTDPVGEEGTKTEE